MQNGCRAGVCLAALRPPWPAAFVAVYANDRLLLWSLAPSATNIAVRQATVGVTGALDVAADNLIPPVPDRAACEDL
jgi:hypothetical protein